MRVLLLCLFAQRCIYGEYPTTATNCVKYHLFISFFRSYLMWKIKGTTYLNEESFFAAFTVYARTVYML